MCLFICMYECMYRFDNISAFQKLVHKYVHMAVESRRHAPLVNKRFPSSYDGTTHYFRFFTSHYLLHTHGCHLFLGDAHGGSSSFHVCACGPALAVRAGDGAGRLLSGFVPARRLLVEGSREKTDAHREDSEGGRVLVPYQHVQQNRQELVHHSDESVCGGTHHATAEPTRIPMVDRKSDANLTTASYV